MFLHFSSRAAALAVASGLLAGSLAGCHPSQAADPRTDPPLVESWTVKPAGTAERSFTGVIAARVESSLGFRVNGKIIQRYVDVGQHVHRGDPLMRLDPDDLALGVSAQQGAVEEARARSAKADADLARLHGLVQLGAISAQDYDLAVEAARSAKAQLGATLAQSDLAKNADKYSVLRADTEGIIVSRAADAGQVVTAGQPVLVLAQDGPLEALITLPETVHPALGSSAFVTLYGPDQESFPAQLRELSRSADPLTRTYAARYVLKGAGAIAPLGATVTVKLSQRGSANDMTVPLGAIYDRGKGPGVWVIGSDSRLTYRAVTVKLLGFEMATVSSGLLAGDKIVALGAHQLDDHEQVRIAGEQWTDGGASADGENK
ncbi:efflux RND transporter periplasmic adaptor subunit [Acerihabitans sp. KWT182]|uniref:Efflux RND transporter periplasmic adaptor subunit n=1 Tax=Acerihabitans sp. KWT182 TaxID=3157919 RepID=A0AAU7QC34_9GAMM